MPHCHEADDYIPVSEKELSIAIGFGITTGIISAISTLSMIFILCFSYQKLVQDKPFAFNLLMIAISDFFVAISWTFGFPDQGALCSIQGFVYMLFGRSSWFFTLALVYQLHHLAIYNRIFFSNRFIFRFIWTLALLINVLPFFFQTHYGIQSEFEGLEACYFAGNNREAFIFLWVIEQIVVFSLLILFTLRIVLYDFCQSRDKLIMNNTSSLLTRSIKFTMLLYPLSMLFTWSPNIIYVLINNYHYIHHCLYLAHPIYVGTFFNSFTPLYGFILSVIFYVQTKEPREEWKRVFKYLYHYFSNNSKDNHIGSFDRSVDMSPLQPGEFTDFQ